jgi:hypothetical protein
MVTIFFGKETSGMLKSKAKLLSAVLVCSVLQKSDQID